MAIDPYEPELAKRQKTLQIAHKQLQESMNRALAQGNQGRVEFIETFNGTMEALRDFGQAGKSLSEWISQKQPDATQE
jgi:hypothetical protein